MVSLCFVGCFVTRRKGLKKEGDKQKKKKMFRVAIVFSFFFVFFFFSWLFDTRKRISEKDERWISAKEITPRKKTNGKRKKPNDKKKRCSLLSAYKRHADDDAKIKQREEFAFRWKVFSSRACRTRARVPARGRRATTTNETNVASHKKALFTRTNSQIFF